MQTSSVGAAGAVLIAVVLMVLGSAAVGCGRSPAASTKAMAPPEDAAPAVSQKVATRADAGVTPALADLRSCPGAVAGAKTKVRDITDGVELTIVAKRPGQAMEIRRRANQLVSVRPGAGGSVSVGCAVHYVPGAETTIEDVTGGVRVKIVAATQDAVDGLRSKARERASAIAHALDASHQKTRG